NCGTGIALIIDKFTGEAAPMTAFLRAERFAKDLAHVNDAARGPMLSILGMTLALLRNYDPFMSPTHFRLIDLLRKFGKKFGVGARRTSLGKQRAETLAEAVRRRRTDRWNFLFIAGMWFQDLFNYDFRRTEMCIIPYATQEGEFSFCAYNTGVGWRQIVEKMHMTATLVRWYEAHDRHEIFAGGKSVPLSSIEHSLVLDPGAVAAPAQTDLEALNIPKTTREEKAFSRRRRDESNARQNSGAITDEADYHLRMARLYREHMLGEKPRIQIQPLRRAAKTR